MWGRKYKDDNRRGYDGSFIKRGVYMSYNKEVFPKVELLQKELPENQNLQIQAYGRRIKKDQTIPEYLLEFLLVFIGESNDKFGFDKASEECNKAIEYRINTNIGLKRFIFFENSKLDNRFEIDSKAYEKLREILKNKISVNSYYEDDVLDIIQELFYGFSAVTKNRGWFAQSLMPICKETIFPEAMGKKGIRKPLRFDRDKVEIDKKFEFKEHNFMARGGEVYYLHILQGLSKIREQDESQYFKLKDSIQNNIFNLINSYPQISTIAKWINSNWNEFMSKHCKEDIEEIEKMNKETMSCQWITERYRRRSEYTVKELNNLLICETSEFEKIDLLNTAIIIQTLRMMVESSKCISENKEESNPMWLIHVPSTSEVDNKVKKLAVQEYKNIEESMEISISKMLERKRQVEFEESNIRTSKKVTKNKSDLILLKEANEDSFKLLRKLGKDIGLITPLRGDNMRLSINDPIIRFLVLSLVEPNTKQTLKTFLKKLYKHYGIVIGPEEYNQYINDNAINSNNDVSYLNYNLMEFQNLLRKNGFLRELSDATSIVENPYIKMEVKASEFVYSSC